MPPQSQVEIPACPLVALLHVVLCPNHPDQNVWIPNKEQHPNINLYLEVVLQEISDDGNNVNINFWLISTKTII